MVILSEIQELIIPTAVELFTLKNKTRTSHFGNLLSASSQDRINGARVAKSEENEIYFILILANRAFTFEKKQCSFIRP